MPRTGWGSRTPYRAWERPQTRTGLPLDCPNADWTLLESSGHSGCSDSGSSRAFADANYQRAPIWEARKSR
eukprot:243174-Alexandrium_andersonii.AAC.1